MCSLTCPVFQSTELEKDLKVYFISQTFSLKVVVVVMIIDSTSIWPQIAFHFCFLGVKTPRVVCCVNV